MADGLDAGCLVRADRVHRTVYTDPAVFTRELVRVFEDGWVFVAHESEVPQEGSFRTTRLGRQPVIVCRHADGQVRVLMNRCMHRGALVCREERGKTATFRCLYHGWTYGTDGSLRSVPFPGGYGAGFDPGALGLIPAPRVGVYRGFIFASLAAQGEDLESHLGRARYYLDLILDAAPGDRITVHPDCERYAYPGNWKLQIENLLDGYHPNFTHQIAFDIAEDRRGASGRKANREDSGATARALGHGHGLLEYSGVNRGYRADDASVAAYRARLEERLGVARAAAVLGADLQLFIFPNLFFQNARQHYRVVQPLAVDQTEVRAYPYALDGAPDAVNARHARDLGWWASAAAFGQPDDLEAFARCQEGLAVAAAPWVLFSRGLDRERPGPGGEVIGDVTDEVPQRGIYREWSRRMAAAAEAGERP